MLWESLEIEGLLPGKLGILFKLKVITVCSKRVATIYVLNMHVLGVWEEMAILLNKKNTSDIATCEEANLSSSHIPQSIYRINNLELRRCSQSHYTSKSIRTTQHLVSEKNGR